MIDLRYYFLLAAVSAAIVLGLVVLHILLPHRVREHWYTVLGFALLFMGLTHAAGFLLAYFEVAR